MTYKLDISQNFEDDLDAILDYISHKLHSPVAAKNLLRSTEEKLKLILENPQLYPLYHDEYLAKRGYRYAIVSNYLVFYVIDENKHIIHIVRFLYGGQNITSNL